MKLPAPSQQQASGPPSPAATTPQFKFSDYVLQYERSYPNATYEDILRYLNGRPWGQGASVATPANTGNGVPYNYNTSAYGVPGTYHFQS